MAKWLFSFMFAALVIFFGCSTIDAQQNQADVYPASTTSGNRAYIMLVVPDLTFMEWRQDRLQNYAHLYRLYTQGHNGAMNIRLPDKGVADLYVTIGAGDKAAAVGEYAMTNEGPQSTGWQRYYQRQGFVSEANEQAAILVPGIAALQQQNKLRYGSAPGTLGELLRRAGINRTVLASSLSTAHQDNRQGSAVQIEVAPLLLMDTEGGVQRGRLGVDLLIRDQTVPGGVHSDYARMLTELLPLDRPGVAVVEISDFSRLESIRASLKDSWFEQQHAVQMQRLNDFVGELLTHMQEEDTLLLFSSHIHEQARKQRLLLAPIVRYEVGTSHAWLTSASTHRLGIVSWMDLAPTITAAFDLDPPLVWPGDTMESTDRATHLPLTWLQQENDRMARIYALRPQVLYPLAIYEMTVLVIALFYLLYRQIAYPKWLQSALYAVLGAPAVLLAAGWWGRLQVPEGPGLIGSGGWYICALLALLFIGCLLLTRCSTVVAMLVICSTIIVLQVVDVFTGGTAIRFSLLGFDAMIGARYYGIGNEMMGVLLGCALLVASLTMQVLPSRRQRVAARWIAVMLIALLVILAAPGLGANAGGAIAAAIGFGYYILMPLWGERGRRRMWLTVGLSGLLLIAAVCLLYVLHVMGGSQHTHIAKGFAHLLEGRWGVIGQIMMRKLSMNWHLLQVSIWSKVLLAGIAVLVVVTLSPDSRFNRQWRKTRTQMLHGFSAISLTVLAALVFNDSGIVAAATMIVYAAVPMLLLPALQPSLSDRKNTRRKDTSAPANAVVPRK